MVTTCCCEIDILHVSIRGGSNTEGMLIHACSERSFDRACSPHVFTEFESMFPEAPNNGMTVVTVTQKTQNDMTAWCEEVDKERELMLDKVSWCHNTVGSFTHSR